MAFEGDSGSFLTSDSVSKLPIRERIGVSIEARDAKDALVRIRDAENAGIRQVWMTVGGSGRADPLTVYAAAGMQTSKIRLGTAIVPIYTRNPLVMALQTLAINDLAPGRFRLGVGPSHRHVIEKTYGIPMKSPLAYLREYVDVLRSGLWDGNIDHHGKFFNINSPFPRRAQVPLLVSALGVKAFRVAGEISDGAITWLCPIPYLLGKALPSLKAGAESRNRPRPPIVAHILVSLDNDERASRDAARKRLEFYVKSPFYAQMFAQAGFPVGADGSGTDAIVKELLIQGDEATVKEKLFELLEKGLDELLVFLVAVTNEDSERKKLLNLLGSL